MSVFIKPVLVCFCSWRNGMSVFIKPVLVCFHTDVNAAPVLVTGVDGAVANQLLDPHLFSKV